MSEICIKTVNPKQKQLAATNKKRKAARGECSVDFSENPAENDKVCGYFDSKETCLEGGRQENLRAGLETALPGEISMVSSSRLLDLLGQTMRWQHGLLSITTDLFHGIATISNQEYEYCPTQLPADPIWSEESRAVECCR